MKNFTYCYSCNPHGTVMVLRSYPRPGGPGGYGFVCPVCHPINPLQEAPVSEPDWSDETLWPSLVGKWVSLWLWNGDTHEGELSQCSDQYSVPGVGWFLTGNIRSIRPVSEDVEWEPATEPWIDGCWCLIEGIRFDRCTDGYWRNTDHGLLVKDSDVRVFGVKVEKSKPSAVPTNVVIEDWGSSSWSQCPEEWLGETVEIRLKEDSRAGTI